MANLPIVLYHYTASPYARRVVWYLALRGIPYKQCIQPPMMPRPDLSQLGIAHRRIPVLSIGRDVYLDTRLQIPKLEDLFPDIPRLGGSNPDQVALQGLLSSFTNDAGLFGTMFQLLPTNLPMLQDPAYYRDRGDFIGHGLTPEGMHAARPESLVAFARVMDFLETALLVDGREWVLKTPTPSLADIEAVWPFHWMTGIPGALPRDRFSPATYPLVYAWIRRFQDAVTAAKKKMGKPTTVSGDDAAGLILSSTFNEAELGVDDADPVAAAQGLRKGDQVAVWPTDTGSSGKDVGSLVGIDSREVVFEAGKGRDKVRVHAPRQGFRIEKSEPGAKL
ncbi:hypothetical protein BGZ63DRAFT_355626 [Mariannaea sp. PMI_226]|nr:hypothetical protein BGZ63DRAFT_355626 [Mariannaea sp. PMI_226]